MTPLAGLYLFLLGLASGFALLAISAYRHVSPGWVRWLLIVSGLLVIGRYDAMAAFATAADPQHVWALRHLWFATSLALPLASALAVDQLIRHPAMTPHKLLVWLAPFLASYGAVMLFGEMVSGPDRVVGWTVHLAPGWQRLLGMTHAVFVLVFLTGCGLLVRKLPSGPIRIALLGLMLSQAALAFDGLLSAFGGWYFRPYLYSEMFTLLALWYAYETSASAA